MLALPLTHAPTLPDADGRLDGQSHLSTGPAGLEDVASAESRIFEAELDVFLAIQPIGNPAQSSNGESNQAAEIFQGEAHLHNATVAPAALRPGGDVLPPDVENASRNLGGPVATPIATAESVSDSEMLRFHDETGAKHEQAISNPIFNTGTQPTLKQAVDIDVNRPEPLLGKTSNSNTPTAQLLQDATEGAKSRALNSDSVALDDVDHQQQPEPTAGNRLSQTTVDAVGKAELVKGHHLYHADETNTPSTHVSQGQSIDSAFVQLATVAHQPPSSTQQAAAHSVAATSVFESGSVLRPYQFVDHVLKARQSMQGGNAQLEVTLDPPELGKITIELTEVDHQLSAKLIVSKNATLDAIKVALPSLMDSLTDAGLTMDHFHLESSDRDNHSSNGRAEAETPIRSTKPDHREFTGSWSSTHHTGVDVLA